MIVNVRSATMTKRMNEAYCTLKLGFQIPEVNILYFIYSMTVYHIYVE